MLLSVAQNVTAITKPRKRPAMPAPRDVINRGHLLPEGLKAPLLRTGSRTASALSLLAMSEGSKPYKFACIERRHAVYCHVSAAHLGRLPVSFLISQRRAPLWYSQARAVLYVGGGVHPGTKSPAVPPSRLRPCPQASAHLPEE